MSAVRKNVFLFLARLFKFDTSTFSGKCPFVQGGGGVEVKSFSLEHLKLL